MGITIPRPPPMGGDMGGEVNMNDLYEHQIRTFMHDYKSNRLPLSFANIFENENQPTATTRRSVSNIYQGLPRTKSVKIVNQ